MILATRLTLIVEKSEKKTCIFTQNWLDQLLLMTSYLVAIATDHHQTCLKICGMNEQFGMNERLLKTSSFYVSSSKKNLKKTLWGEGGGGGGGIHVRPRVKNLL